MLKLTSHLVDTRGICQKCGEDISHMLEGKELKDKTPVGVIIAPAANIRSAYLIGAKDTNPPCTK
jgi:hypothetical protein